MAGKTTKHTPSLLSAPTTHPSTCLPPGNRRHEAGRINYVTPTSYLELITTFTTLLASKRAEVLYDLMMI